MEIEIKETEKEIKTVNSLLENYKIIKIKISNVLINGIKEYKLNYNSGKLSKLQKFINNKYISSPNSKLKQQLDLISEKDIDKLDPNRIVIISEKEIDKDDNIAIVENTNLKSISDKYDSILKDIKECESELGVRSL